MIVPQTFLGFQGLGNFRRTVHGFHGMSFNMGLSDVVLTVKLESDFWKKYNKGEVPRDSSFRLCVCNISSVKVYKRYLR